MKRRLASGLLGLTLLCSSTVVLGAETVVLRVVVVHTDNPDGYVKEIERARVLLKRLISPSVVRVWRARFAGPDSSNIVVSVEYPSMAAFAADDAKIAADTEYQTWLKGLDKSRKVISESLYTELKP